MKTNLMLAGLTGVGLLLAGCATTGAPQASGPAGGAIPGAPFGEAPAQKLDQGECLLALWSRTTPPLRFLVASDRPAQAWVRLNGRDLALPRVSQQGQPAFGHFPEQQFAGQGVTMTVRLEIDATKPLPDGAVVNGTVDYRNAEGWTTVVAAAGMLACKG